MNTPQNHLNSFFSAGIGDLISPFKAAIGLDYKAFEQRILKAIYERYGVGEISAETGRAIKAADTMAAYYEATVLAGFSREEAERFFGRPELPLSLDRELRTLTAVSTGEAQKGFLDRFNKLGGFL